MLELGVDWNSGGDIPLLGVQAPPLDAILAVVVLAALLLRRRGAGRSDLEDQSSWQAADEVRPIPRELAVLPEVRSARIGLGVLVAVAALVLPHLLSVDLSLKASAVLIYAILGLSIVVLTGWAGQVSLGQVAFFAIGAAVSAWLTRTYELDLTLTVLAAGIVGAVAAVIVGLPALRFRGLYLAVTTFAFALATTSYLLNRRYFEWVPSQRVTRQPLFGRIDIASATSIYYVMLAALALVVLALRGVRRSRTGRVLVAMRDNERAAQAFGVSAVRTKLTAFAISGFLAAAAGSLFLAHQQAFGSSPYAPSQNLAIFAMVVVGGVTSVGGALLGALYFQGTGWFLPLDWQFVASGFGVLVVLLVLPGGLGGLVYAIRDQGLRFVAGRRGIVVASLLADRRHDEAEPEPVPLPGTEGGDPSGVTDEDEPVLTGGGT